LKREEPAATQAHFQEHHGTEKRISEDVKSAFEIEVAKSSETQNMAVGAYVFV
jgi:hypothetical protein